MMDEFEEGLVPSVQRGMFVSGWDDPDDLIEEDENPQSKNFSIFLNYFKTRTVISSRLTRPTDPVGSRKG